jgi:DNA-binding response OmpR family regulator
MASKKILIVEDEPALKEALARKIKESGFEVLEAGNGEIALEVALKEHPDLILLDVIMPKMDGMTMLKKLREDEWGKGAKIIMLTNLSNAEEIEESIKNGVHDYLIKTDWKINDIIAKMKERLE